MVKERTMISPQWFLLALHFVKLWVGNNNKEEVEMNKEIIEEYQRMKKERDALYVRTLNLNIGSGLRVMKDELYVKEANLKKYMWLHNLTDDFTHDL
jgi:hypothetical protein